MCVLTPRYNGTIQTSSGCLKKMVIGEIFAQCQYRKIGEKNYVKDDMSKFPTESFAVDDIKYNGSEIILHRKLR